MKNGLQKATPEEIERQSALPVTVVHKLATIQNSEPLVKSPETSLSFISKQIVYVYAFLGHRNIFQQKGAKEQIQESASIILSSIESSPRLRYFRKEDLEATIKKGCAGEFDKDDNGQKIEVKHFSPNLVIRWIKAFDSRITPKVRREVEKLQEIKLLDYKDKEQERTVGNIQTVNFLFEQMEDLETNLFFDVRKFLGRFISRELCVRYPVGDHLIQNYTKRADLWKDAMKKAENEEPRKGEKYDKKRKNLTVAQYCRNLFDAFREEYQGDEMLKEHLISTIKNYKNGESN